MALIESIQINKADKMRLFFIKNAVKAKAFGALPRPPWGSFQRSPNSLANVIGCNSREVLYFL